MAYLTTTYGSSRIAAASARRGSRASDRFDLFAIALSAFLLALAFVAHAHGFYPPVEDATSASDLDP
jgi:hypothetical protein